MKGVLYRQQPAVQQVGMFFKILTVHVFSFLWSKRNGSQDTCVAGVTTPDGPALVMLALQVEPRRPCGEQKKTRWLGWKILQPQILDSENVTSERPLAIMLTMIRWWEAVRALEGQ